MVVDQVARGLSPLALQPLALKKMNCTDAATGSGFSNTNPDVGSSSGENNFGKKISACAHEVIGMVNTAARTSKQCFKTDLVSVE
jgi:hypothetical protein